MKVMFTVLIFGQTRIVTFTVFSLGHLYSVILNSVILTSLEPTPKSWLKYTTFSLVTDHANFSLELCALQSSKNGESSFFKMRAVAKLRYF